MPQQPQPNSQPAPPPPWLHGRGCNYCNYPHTSYACITPNPVRRGCGHLAPLTNQPPPSTNPPTPTRNPTGFDRRYNFKLPTVGGLWPRSDREILAVIGWRGWVRISHPRPSLFKSLLLEEDEDDDDDDDDDEARGRAGVSREWLEGKNHFSRLSITHRNFCCSPGIARDHSSRFPANYDSSAKR